MLFSQKLGIQGSGKLENVIFSLVVTNSLMLKHSNKLSIDPRRVKFKNMTYSININDDKSIQINEYCNEP